MKPLDARDLGSRLEDVNALALSAYLGARGIHQNEDPEAVRVQTRAIRQALDGIEQAVGAAQELLSGIETDAGLVREDGSRVDDPPK